MITYTCDKCKITDVAKAMDEQAALTLVELFFMINKPELALGTLDQFFIAMVRNKRGTRIRENAAVQFRTANI